MNIKNFINDIRLENDERELMVITSAIFFILCFIVTPFVARWSWLEIVRQHPWGCSFFMYFLASGTYSSYLLMEYWNDENKYKGKRLWVALRESIELSLDYGFGWPIIGLKIISYLISKSIGLNPNHS